jgi:hypothetical protein
MFYVALYLVGSVLAMIFVFCAGKVTHHAK